jgi:hypothetical protein
MRVRGRHWCEMEEIISRKGSHSCEFPFNSRKQFLQHTHTVDIKEAIKISFSNSHARLLLKQISCKNSNIITIQVEGNLCMQMWCVVVDFHIEKVIFMEWWSTNFHARIIRLWIWNFLNTLSYLHKYTFFCDIKAPVHSFSTLEYAF